MISIKTWYSLFEEPTAADVIIGRMIHDAYRSEQLFSFNRHSCSDSSEYATTPKCHERILQPASGL